MRKCHQPPLWLAATVTSLPPLKLLMNCSGTACSTASSFSGSAATTTTFISEDLALTTCHKCSESNKQTNGRNQSVILAGIHQVIFLHSTISELTGPVPIVSIILIINIIYLPCLATNRTNHVLQALQIRRGHHHLGEVWQESAGTHQNIFLHDTIFKLNRSAYDTSKHDGLEG